MAPPKLPKALDLRLLGFISFVFAPTGFGCVNKPAQCGAGRGHVHAIVSVSTGNAGSPQVSLTPWGAGWVQTSPGALKSSHGSNGT